VQSCTPEIPRRHALELPSTDARNRARPARRYCSAKVPADGCQRAADVAVVDMDMVQAGAQLALCYSYAQNEPDVCVLASLAQHVYTH
jgi:hypothetical protein